MEKSGRGGDHGRQLKLLAQNSNRLPCLRLLPVPGGPGIETLKQPVTGRRVLRSPLGEPWIPKVLLLDKRLLSTPANLVREALAVDRVEETRRGNPGCENTRNPKQSQR